MRHVQRDFARLRRAKNTANIFSTRASSARKIILRGDVGRKLNANRQFARVEKLFVNFLSQQLDWAL
jgi:hypothetical protein